MILRPYIKVSKKLILVILFLIGWMFIGLSIIYFGWNETWSFLKIPAMMPIFADMRSVQGGLLTSYQGLNPQVINPGDPWQRTMNYPSIWIKIAHLLQLDNEVRFIIFMLSIVSAFLFSCLLILFRFPSAFNLLVMFSGATLLAVERGNNDLLVFSLLYFATLASNEYLASFAFLISAILKVYPIVAIIQFYNNVKIFLYNSILMISYLYLIRNEFNHIQKGNTAFGKISYGFKNVFLILNQQDHLVVYFLIIIVTLLMIYILKLNLGTNQNIYEPKKKKLFLIGGSIYTLTYLFSLNYDYRLIFLLFCIPYLCGIESKFIKSIGFTNIYL